MPEVGIIFSFFAIDPGDLANFSECSGGESPTLLIEYVNPKCDWVWNERIDPSNWNRIYPRIHIHPRILGAKFRRRNRTDKLLPLPGNIYLPSSFLLRRAKLSLVLLCRKWINDWTSAIAPNEWMLLGGRWKLFVHLPMLRKSYLPLSRIELINISPFIGNFLARNLHRPRFNWPAKEEFDTLDSGL